MSTHNKGFLREIRKNVNFQASKSCVGQVDFDHLLVRGQVIKFDNSSPLDKGHQNLITSSPNSNNISVLIWSNSIHRFMR